MLPQLPQVRRLLSSRPAIVVLAAALALLLIGAGHQKGRHGTFIPGTSWDQVTSWQGGSSSDGLQLLAEAPPLTLYEPRAPYNYMWVNDVKLRNLAACTARRNCPKNADKIAIISVYHCHLAVFDNYRGGEGIWCMSAIESLERQGYTVLHAGESDWDYILHLYRQMPDMIKAIIADDGTVIPPLIDLQGKYFKNEERPWGIPAWKFFRFSFYGNALSTIVGQAWSVCAEPEWKDKKYPRIYTHLPYALVPAHPTVIPFHERPHRVYIMGKRQQYLYTFQNMAAMFSIDDLKYAYDELKKDYPDVEFVGSFIDDSDDESKAKWGPFTVPEFIDNHGKLDKEGWGALVAQSRLMLGIGWPPTSPSPYHAFARGVPFLNPIDLGTDGRLDDPNTYKFWQHESILNIPEPTVYSVVMHDAQGLTAAIRRAFETPLEPFVTEHMRQEVVDERLDWLMTHDWRSDAARILEQRKAGTETQGDSEHIGIFEL